MSPSTKATAINVVLDEGNIAAGEVIDDHDVVAPRTPSRSMRCDPMKPAPPVTKARMDGPQNRSYKGNGSSAPTG